MGRKTRRRVITRPRPSIPDIFECPNCNEQSVRVTIDRKSRTAIAECGHCHASEIGIPVRSIDEKVDVYSEFIDRYYRKFEAGEVNTAPPPVQETVEEKDTDGESKDVPSDGQPEKPE
ncbi:MAG: transcription elongation factor 1 family protein [Candidatus Hodarchaeales archaeon]